MSFVGSLLEPTFPPEGHLVAHAFPHLCREILCPNPQASSFKRCLTGIYQWNQQLKCQGHQTAPSSHGATHLEGSLPNASLPTTSWNTMTLPVPEVLWGRHEGRGLWPPLPMYSHTPLIFSRTFYQVCFLPRNILWLLVSKLSRCYGLSCPLAISLDFSCF